MPGEGGRQPHSLPCSDHPLGCLYVSLQSRISQHVGDELLLSLPESQLGQAILVGDGLIFDSAQAQDQCTYQARSVFACGAVDE